MRKAVLGSGIARVCSNGWNAGFSFVEKIVNWSLLS